MSSVARIALLVLWVLCLTSSAAMAEDRRLEHQASEQPLIYRTTATIEQEQTLGDMNLDGKMSFTDVSVWTFQHEDADGNRHWQLEIKRLNVTGNVGRFGEFAFDSESNQRPAGTQLDASLRPVCQALSGAMFQVTLDPQGRVVTVTGFDGFITPLVKDNIFALQYLFGGTDQSAKFIFQERFPVFAKDAVAAGAAWNVPYDFEMPGFGKLSGSRHHSLKKVTATSGQETAELDWTYGLSFEGAAEATGVRFSGNLTSDQSSGTARVDVATGQVQSLDSSISAAGTFSVDVGGQTFSVPTKQKWKVTVERLSELPADASSPQQAPR